MRKIKRSGQARLVYVKKIFKKYVSDTNNETDDSVMCSHAPARDFEHVVNDANADDDDSVTFIFSWRHEYSHALAPDFDDDVGHANDDVDDRV